MLHICKTIYGLAFSGGKPFLSQIKSWLQFCLKDIIINPKINKRENYY